MTRPPRRQERPPLHQVPLNHQIEVHQLSIQERQTIVTIIVGYTPNPEGLAALDAGIEEARRRKTSLVVLNSARGGSYTDINFASPEDLSRVEDALRDSGIDYEIEQKVTHKYPADAILDAANTHDAELIVIGLKHRRPTGKLIFGSNAQQVLLGAKSPVLAVKA